LICDFPFQLLFVKLLGVVLPVLCHHDSPSLSLSPWLTDSEITARAGDLTPNALAPGTTSRTSSLFTKIQRIGLESSRISSLRGLFTNFTTFAASLSSRLLDFPTSRFPGYLTSRLASRTDLLSSLIAEPTTHQSRFHRRLPRVPYASQVLAHLRLSP
jgi:hypothetical protein